MLRRGNNRHDTMLITVNIQRFLAEAASAAQASPCRHGVVQTPLSTNPALAGRHAR
jgi:hypothetical protein